MTNLVEQYKEYFCLNYFLWSNAFKKKKKSHRLPIVEGFYALYFLYLIVNVTD